MKHFISLCASFLIAVPALAGPDEDLAAFRDFYIKSFPLVELADHKDGAYALDEAKREQWLEMEDFPPYEIAVDDGAELYSEAFPNGKSYADCLGEQAPAVKHLYPRFNDNEGRVETLEWVLNTCRLANGLPALDYLGEQMAALTAYIAMASRGKKVNVVVPDDERALAAYNAGKQFYYSRRGQLNFACSSCHMQITGRMLRAERLSAAIGHTTHWPVYRGKWERVGALHERFRECNEQVRAVPFEPQGEEYRNLEYFLTYMNNGMELNGPATRK
ncbi:MAG: sulfur oxidation c-type cytochrome SoxA [Halieaceae bacterium]|jgi:L-cysteine S-thiosulfotransferase|nr:sulfur oxidation c-type cytochrome SoxA [Halieaceae bacterium]